MQLKIVIWVSKISFRSVWILACAKFTDYAVGTRIKIGSMEKDYVE